MTFEQYAPVVDEVLGPESAAALTLALVQIEADIVPPRPCFDGRGQVSSLTLERRA